jgi:hypothetical protein
VRALGACADQSASVRPAVLDRHEWTERAESHRERVRVLLQDGMVDHKGAQPDGTEFGGLDPKNPIFNFLLDYYNIRGRKGTRRLAKWSPGINVVLRDAEHGRDVEEPQGLLARKCVRTDAHGGGLVFSAVHLAAVDPDTFAKTFEWYRMILAATAEHQPVLNCFGLHEWAMIYRPPGAPEPPSLAYQKDVLPLRVSQEVINAAVERRGVKCTHIDAIRFFAQDAAPLNKHTGTEWPKPKPTGCDLPHGHGGSAQEKQGVCLARADARCVGRSRAGRPGTARAAGVRARIDGSP